MLVPLQRGPVWLWLIASAVGLSGVTIAFRWMHVKESCSKTWRWVAEKLTLCQRQVVADKHIRRSEPSTQLLCHFPAIEPLVSLEQLLSWSPGSRACDPYARAGCFLPPGRLHPAVAKPALLVCHDMMGGYQEDRWVQGGEDPSFYRIWHWDCIDYFVYFSHHLVTIPPVGWINTAHRQGVRVLGTFITEHSAGRQVCCAMLEDMQKAEEAADQLVAIARYFCFEGWLLNIENSLPSSRLDNLRHFVSYLRARMHSEVPHGVVIWYDAVTNQGRLSFQNSLSPANQCYLDASDGLFVNYHWNQQTPAASAAAAGERKGDVFMGIDVFGRGTFGGGQENCDVALQVIRSHDLSAALFAPGWVYECHNKAHFVELQNQFWGKVERAWPAHGLRPLQLPLVLNFDQGCGTGQYIQGHCVDTRRWYHLSSQSLQPCWSGASLSEGGGGSLQADVSLEFAYRGGACLLLHSPRPLLSPEERPLLRVLVPLPPCGLTVRFTLLCGAGSDMALVLQMGRRDPGTDAVTDLVQVVLAGTEYPEGSCKNGTMAQSSMRRRDTQEEDTNTLSKQIERAHAADAPGVDKVTPDRVLHCPDMDVCNPNGAGSLQEPACLMSAPLKMGESYPIFDPLPSALRSTAPLLLASLSSKQSLSPKGWKHRQFVVLPEPGCNSLVSVAVRCFTSERTVRESKGREEHTETGVVQVGQESNGGLEYGGGANVASQREEQAGQEFEEEVRGDINEQGGREYMQQGESSAWESRANTESTGRKSAGIGSVKSSGSSSDNSKEWQHVASLKGEGSRKEGSGGSSGGSVVSQSESRESRERATPERESPVSSSGGSKEWHHIATESVQASQTGALLDPTLERQRQHGSFCVHLGEVVLHATHQPMAPTKVCNLTCRLITNAGPPNEVEETKSIQGPERTGSVHSRADAVAERAGGLSKLNERPGAVNQVAGALDERAGGLDEETGSSDEGTAEFDERIGGLKQGAGGVEGSANGSDQKASLSSKVVQGNRDEGGHGAAWLPTGELSMDERASSPHVRVQDVAEEHLPLTCELLWDECLDAAGRQQHLSYNIWALSTVLQPNSAAAAISAHSASFPSASKLDSTAAAVSAHNSSAHTAVDGASARSAVASVELQSLVDTAAGTADWSCGLAEQYETGSSAALQQERKSAFHVREVPPAVAARWKWIGQAFINRFFVSGMSIASAVSAPNTKLSSAQGAPACNGGAVRRVEFVVQPVLLNGTSPCLTECSNICVLA